MPVKGKTAAVTSGSQGIGASLMRTFLDHGYNVVANSRSLTKSLAFEASDKLALLGEKTTDDPTPAKIVEVAKSKLGSIDALVNVQLVFRFFILCHGWRER